MREIETETQLRAVLRNGNAVLVCFHSTRSAYSRRTVKILAEIAEDFQMVEFYLLDADRENFLPLLAEFRVVGLPTISFFRAGVRGGCLIGERSEKALAILLESLLKP